MRNIKLVGVREVTTELIKHEYEKLFIWYIISSEDSHTNGNASIIIKVLIRNNYLYILSFEQDEENFILRKI